MTVIYYEDSATLDILRDQSIGVIGYNPLARSMALNLRDSDLRVVVGGTEVEQQQAAQEGFTCDAAASITHDSDVILLLQEDEAMPEYYIRDIAPNLHRGNALLFASAYNVTFGFIEPPPFVDVGLVAPRITGSSIRTQFEQRKGFPSFVAVWQDASRHAWKRVLAVALAVGGLRAGAVELSFAQETELSLFVQQTALPLMIHSLTTAAELLMDTGYPPEAILTDLYLSGRFTSQLNHAASQGLAGMLAQQTQTEQYGTLSKLERFHNLNLERLMEISLQEIRSGQYAKEWGQDYVSGGPRLTKLMSQFALRELWDLEQQTLDAIGDPPLVDDGTEFL